MMGYLDRLKGANPEKCLPSTLPKPPKAPFGSYDSTQGGRFQKIAPAEQGATCPAGRATLPADLERRILAMAERWGYSGDDLALALEDARKDQDGWRRVVEADEATR